LNPVAITLLDTHKVHLGEENTTTEAEVLAVKTPEMLKALN